MLRFVLLLLSAAAGFALAGGAVLAVKFALDDVYHPREPLQRSFATDSATDSGPYIPAEFAADEGPGQKSPAAARMPGITSEPLVDGDVERDDDSVLESATAVEAETEADAGTDSAAETNPSPDLGRRRGGERQQDEAAIAARSSRVTRAPRRVRRARAERRPRPRDRSRTGRAVRRDRRAGFITVSARPYATVFVDGRRVGDTPLVRYRVPSGKRRLKVVAPDGDQVRETIHLSPGETEGLRFRFD